MESETDNGRESLQDDPNQQGIKMAFRMRSSKFRHVFGSPAKKDKCYECVKITRETHDSNFCAVNPKFIAIVTECSGGGSFLVLPLDRTGRIDTNAPRVCGHRGPVLDIKWNPFNDHIIASCSHDTTVKLWKIPERGLHSNLTEWLVDLHGHQRKVGYLEWHPTAENILLSAGFDFKCILWNTETAEPISIIDVHHDTIFSIAWNREGSLFATTCKDKKLRIIDPREGHVVAETQGHLGSKASKVVFLPGSRLFTTGFSRMNERQYAIWDMKNMTKPLKIDQIDCSSGVIVPYFDFDTNVVFLAGKGDGNIRYYEIVPEAPYAHYLSQYQTGYPQRSLGVMPKRGVNVKKCEIVRFYKLHTDKDICEPISMIVPRKSEMFQEDIYPPTASSCPSLSASDWISGQNREPILVSLKDGIVTKNPTITTYKAVKRAPSNSELSSSTNKRSAPLDNNNSSSRTSLDKLPASLRNIHKLSSDGTDSNGYEPQRTVSSTEPTTRLTNANEAMQVDKKTWSSGYTSVLLSQNSARNGLPDTDPEVRAFPPPSRSQQSPSPQPDHRQLFNSHETALLSPHNSKTPEQQQQQPTHKLHNGHRSKPGYLQDKNESTNLFGAAGDQRTENRFNRSPSPARSPGVWQSNPAYAGSHASSDVSHRVSSMPFSPDRNRLPQVDSDRGRMPLADMERNRMPQMDYERKKVPSVDSEQSRFPVVDTDRFRKPLVDTERSRIPLVDKEKSQMPVDTGPLDAILLEQSAEVQRARPGSFRGITDLPSLVSKQPDPMTKSYTVPELSSDGLLGMRKPTEEVDGDRSELIDLISNDAPDDTLIKPSKLRSSMRSRQRGSLPGGSVGGALPQRSASFREIRSRPKEHVSDNEAQVVHARIKRAEPPVDLFEDMRRSRMRETRSQSPTGAFHAGRPASQEVRGWNPPQTEPYASHASNSMFKMSTSQGDISGGVRFQARDQSERPSSKKDHFRSAATLVLEDSPVMSPSLTSPCFENTNQNNFKFTVPDDRSKACSSNYTFSVPKSSPSSIYPSTEVISSGDAPLAHSRRNLNLNLSPRQNKEDDSRVHVKKVWSPMSPTAPLNGFENGHDVPSTDPELRKAYFLQLEEIKSLKQQISVKDKRIRQLEEELTALRAPSDDIPGESNC